MTEHSEYTPKEKAVDYSSAPETPRWVAFVSSRSSAAVQSTEEESVMAWPHLIVREVLLLEIMIIVMTVLALWLDAPLEELANPEHSPNPAKAPWYFLGLQELLHYFPPVVAGVLIPMFVVAALMAVPYIRMNIDLPPLWNGDRSRTLYSVIAGYAGVAVCTVPFHAWAIFIPTTVIAGAMMLPALFQPRRRWQQRWAAVPLADWLMLWFITCAVILTVIGIFFRGPEWQWILPWQDGVYY